MLKKNTSIVNDTLLYISRETSIPFTTHWLGRFSLVEIAKGHLQYTNASCITRRTTGFYRKNIFDHLLTTGEPCGTQHFKSEIQ